MRLCRREGGSGSTMKGCLMHQRSCRSQSLPTCLTTFLPGLERRNCRTHWRMRGESPLVLREQFALGGERTHYVMCGIALQKLKRLGWSPARLKKAALCSSRGIQGHWKSRLAKKIDRSVGLQSGHFNVASHSSSVPMKLAFADPLEMLADQILFT